MDLAPASRQHRALLCPSMEKKEVQNDPSPSPSNRPPRHHGGRRRSRGEPPTRSGCSKSGPTVADLAAGQRTWDYTITVANVKVGEEVHAYVARTDPNWGCARATKPSHFVDARWSKTARPRPVISASMRVRHERVADQSPRALNGLATGKADRLRVAGGYILGGYAARLMLQQAPHAAAPLRFAIVPTYALPCDESCALGGMRAGGNRSGSVFRLIAPVPRPAIGAAHCQQDPPNRHQSACPQFQGQSQAGRRLISSRRNAEELASAWGSHARRHGVRSVSVRTVARRRPSVWQQH
jgi:hypothetical protein